MIARIELRQDVRGMVWVACHCVKIDHAIERTTAANPPVDRLAFLLLVRVVIPLERLALFVQPANYQETLFRLKN